MESTKLSASMTPVNFGGAAGEEKQVPSALPQDSVNSLTDKVEGAKAKNIASSNVTNASLEKGKVTESSSKITERVSRWVSKALGAINFGSFSSSGIAFFAFAPGASALFLGGSLFMGSKGSSHPISEKIEEMPQFMKYPEDFRPKSAGEFCIYRSGNILDGKHLYQLSFYDGKETKSYSLNNPESRSTRPMSYSQIEDFVNKLNKEMESGSEIVYGEIKVEIAPEPIDFTIVK